MQKEGFFGELNLLTSSIVSKVSFEYTDGSHMVQLAKEKPLSTDHSRVQVTADLLTIFNLVEFLSKLKVSRVYCLFATTVTRSKVKGSNSKHHYFFQQFNQGKQDGEKEGLFF